MTNATTDRPVNASVAATKPDTKIVKSARAQFEELIKYAPEFVNEDFQLEYEAEYEEVLKHIAEHKYLTNELIPYEINNMETIFSWYENVYQPITLAIDQLGLAAAFPGKTRAQMFLWVCRHWHYLKAEKKAFVSVEEATCSFGAKFSRKPLMRLFFRIQQAFV